jgi:hypothetical protein
MREMRGMREIKKTPNSALSTPKAPFPIPEKR